MRILAKITLLAVCSVANTQALSQLVPTTRTPSLRNRVFVSGLRENEMLNNAPSIEQDLLEAFREYGTVQDVLVIGVGKSSRGSNLQPYAFVTFDEADAAQRALGATCITSSIDSIDHLFKSVTPALEKQPRKRRIRSNAEWEKRLQFTKGCNVIVQVQKSHLERLEDFVMRKHAVLAAKILGSFDTSSRTISLIFIKADDPVAFMKTLYHIPFVAKTALNKIYLVSGAAEEGDIMLVDKNEDSNATSRDTDCSSTIKTTLLGHLESLSSFQQENGDKAVVRLSVFPPKILPSVLSILKDADYLNDDDSSKVSIGPTANTHTLSIVQVSAEHSASPIPGLYMMGLADSDKDIESAIRDENDTRMTDDVCRAYFKLQEAFSRYDAPNGSTFDQSAEGSSTSSNLLPSSAPFSFFSNSKNMIALDCGAAPGGWTKYLSEELGCSKVYSVDPGDLSPVVSSLDGVQHLQTTIADAWSSIKKAESDGIDLWVSDMCLHDPSAQVDSLLEGISTGIVRSGTMFVLTLKFVKGHAKATFDKQAQEEVDRLEGIATGMQTIHLFSNRNGERTIMGFVK